MAAAVQASRAGTPVAICWSMGDLRGANPLDLRAVDVRMSPVAMGDAGRGFTWSITQALEPLRSRFLCADGNEVEVQNFRYVGMDGVPRRMLWCVACGRPATVDSADFLMRSLPECCRKCGAGFSPRCDQHHAYGRCLSCDPGTLGVP
jgi:uncharacterized CHY-type Zn-finger protein